MLGQSIEDRYLVAAELGAGAMGHVYRARHVKVGRQVAIKVMHPELARVPTIVERFAREARIAARLNHPNLVGVLDVGMTADRLPLIVLELAPGTSLYQLMVEAMPRERYERIVRQLMLALQHAHASGLIHRDLKPDNILVETLKDNSEVPRIVDFGIAVCTAKDDAIANSRLTEANTVIGTPAYMSPEQAMAKDLDARTDLFSLGVIMYEMLAGMTPFDGSGVDVAIASSSKDAPSIADRAGIMVDPLLEAFVKKLMARKLADRFQSARDALIMLDRIESDRIDAARALSTPSASPDVVALPSASHVRHDNTDRLATRPVTAVTRIEVLTRPRPSRRRMAGALALAVAAMTAFVGWSFRDDAPVIGASHAQAALVGQPAASMPVLDAPAAVFVVAPVATPVIAVAPVAVAPVAVAPVEPAASRIPAPRTAKAAIATRAPRSNAQVTAIVATPVAEPAPVAIAPTEIGDTSSAVAARYVAVGRALRGSSDELWARYRLIRINDALKTEASRREVLATLTDIERARSAR
jgi:serine/threonine-protein kinase